MIDKNDFFEDMAIVLKSWINSSSEAITDEYADLIWADGEESFRRIRDVLSENGADKTDVEQVFSECLRGLAVSFLTVLDGGTALAEKGRVYLVDEDGNRLGEGLHDDFFSHLLEAGRLK